MNHQQSIGIFDSGVGGLSIAKSLNEHLPYEHLHYIADQLHLPYGTKTSDYLIQRALDISKLLIDQGSKAIVVACNTATSMTIAELRKNFSCPIFGIEPGLKPASEKSKSSKVGVLATTQTINSASFKQLHSRFEESTNFYCQACPGLAQHIEELGVDASDTTGLLKKYLQPLLDKNIDTLVLGCTHYSHLIPQINSMSLGKLLIIEPSYAVTKHIKNTLGQQQLLSLIPQTQQDLFWTNNDRITNKMVISRLWKSEVSFGLF